MSRIAIIYLILLLNCVNSAFSQKLIVSGKVVDENNQPIAYANVYLLHSNEGSITNIEGKFEFSILKEISNDTLVVSIIGYEEKQIPLTDYSGEKAIKLSQYIKTFDEVTVREKKTDPYEILYKTFSNTRFNFPDSTYNLDIFSRLFIKYDTTFVFYRRTLAEVEAIRDNIWFVNGDIIADQVINSDKLTYKKQGFGGQYYEILNPAIDFERVNRDFDVEKKYLSKIDTVYFYGADKIYVIDIWNKKMNDGNINLSQAILDNAPNPYEMIFSPAMEKLGISMAEDDSYLMRFYINASENYAIIRQISVFVSSYPGNTFNYIISDFNNESGMSYPVHIISYILEIKDKSDVKPITLTSLNEIFCYNMISPAAKTFENDTSLYSKYSHVLYHNLDKFTGEFNTWNGQNPYILTDSLQEYAISSIKLAKQLPGNFILDADEKNRKNKDKEISLPNIKMKGKIVDSISGEPIIFCNIVFHNDDISKTRGGITDENGNFAIDVQLGEKYLMEISLVGYTTIKDSIDFKVENTEDELRAISWLDTEILDLDVGIIEISKSSILLDEVEIAESATSFELSKQTVIVTKELTNNSIAAKDVLHKIDGLQYNYVNGDLKVDNDKNVKMLVDGVEKEREYILNINPKRIRKIEIVRDVTGLYRMQGYSSVVNIITHANYRGVDALLSGQYLDKAGKKDFSYFTDGSANLSLDITRDKWSFYFKVNANSSENALYSTTKTKYTDFDMQILSSSDTLPNNFNKSSGYNFSLGTDYRINQKHIIGGEFSVKGFPASSLDLSRSVDSVITATDSLRQVTSINSLSEYARYSGNLYYNFKINKSSRLIAYLASTYNTKDYTQTLNGSEFLSYKRDYSNLKFNTDYANTIKERYTLSAGFSYLENKSVNKSQNSDFSNFYSKTQAFTDLDIMINKNSHLSFGSSFEYYYQKNDESDAIFNSFQPHASFKAKLNKRNKIALNYGLTTEYPELSDLIPQTVYLSSFLVIRGNPSLKPYQYHKVSAEYSHYGESVFSYLSFKPYYQYSGNSSGYKSIINESIIEYTTENFVKYERLGISTSLSFDFTKKLSTNIDFDLFREQNINLETPVFIDWTGGVQLNYNISTSWFSGLMYQKDKCYTVNSLGYSRTGFNYLMVYLMTMQFKGRLQFYVGYSLPWLSGGINESYESTPAYERTNISDASIMKNMFFVNISFRLSNGKVKTSDVNIREELPEKEKNNDFLKF